MVGKLRDNIIPKQLSVCSNSALSQRTISSRRIAGAALLLTAALAFSPLADGPFSARMAQAKNTQEEKRALIKKILDARENAGPATIHCPPFAFLDRTISTPEKTIRFADITATSVSTYQGKFVVELSYSDGKMVFSDKSVIEDGKCGLFFTADNAFKAERKNKTYPAKVIYEYFDDVAKEQRNCDGVKGFFGPIFMWAGVALAGWLLIRVIRKIWGGHVNKKEAELEKLAQEYEKKLIPYMKKFWDAKSLDELRVLGDEKMHIIHEITSLDKKKWNGKLFERLRPIIYRASTIYQSSLRKHGESSFRS